MFRLLPWSSSVVGGGGGGSSSKVTAPEDVKVMAPPRPQHLSPVVEIPASLHRLKRKRADSVSGEGDDKNKNTNNDMENHHDNTGQSHHPPNKMSMTDHAEIANNNTKNNSDKDDNNNNNNNTADTTNTRSSSTSNMATPAGTKSTEGATDLDRVDNSSNDNAASKLRAPKREMDPDTLRETLESQLSLEVLLKHDELRLIDQEIAKCQVALEQLRRCAEIPYPAANSSGGLSLAVSGGNGFSTATAPAESNRLPSSPAPWGVSDGPYSRHYARWLLPDRRFDGGEPEPAAAVPHAVGYGAASGKGLPEGRTTRASWTDSNGPQPITGPTPRAQRSTAGAKLQALSSGYPPPKDKAGPMIIKRKSDGKLVKLVCIDCRRDNFSSTQGFINHCRIAHNRSFASHDAAAVASGEPVEVDDSGAVVGSEKDTPSSGPPGYVHPLIRSAHLVDSNGKQSPSNKSSAQTPLSSSRKPSRKPTKKHSTTATPTTSSTRSPTTDDLPLRRTDPVDTNDASTFKASPQTPHLSALMQRRGHDLDLLDIVDDALTKSEIDMYPSGDDSGEEEEGPDAGSRDEKPALNAKNGRLPTRTVPSPSNPRPGSQKSADKGSRKPVTAPLRAPCTLPPSSPRFTTTTTTRQLPEPGEDVDMVDGFSPNTVESNQAPSLVSDHGEYGGRSETESPIPSSAASNLGEATFDDVEVQDGDDGNDSTTTGSAAADRPAGPPITGKGNQHRPAPIPSPAHATGTVRKGGGGEGRKKKQGRGKQATGNADTAVTNSNDDGNNVEAGRVTFASPATTTAAPAPASTPPKKGNAKRQRRK